MAFAPELPSFNLLADFWPNPTTPATHPPGALAIPCQLYFDPRHGGDDKIVSTTQNEVAVYLRIPAHLVTAGTIDPKRISGWRLMHPPMARPFYYVSMWWEFMHWGFPNEYVLVRVLQANANLAPPDVTR